MNEHLRKTEASSIPHPEGSAAGIHCALVTTSEEREAIFALRMQVFVEEQAVPVEEELDAYDVTAIHFLAQAPRDEPGMPGSVVGVARLLDKGGGTAKIGRVAVRADYRNRGIGSRLMQFVEQSASERGFRRAVLEAQVHAIPFYEKLGYTTEGPVFLDANIPHRLMSKELG